MSALTKDNMGDPIHLFLHSVRDCIALVTVTITSGVASSHIEARFEPNDGGAIFSLVSQSGSGSGVQSDRRILLPEQANAWFLSIVDCMEDLSASRQGPTTGITTTIEFAIGSTTFRAITTKIGLADDLYRNVLSLCVGGKPTQSTLFELPRLASLEVPNTKAADELVPIEIAGQVFILLSNIKWKRSESPVSLILVKKSKVIRLQIHGRIISIIENSGQRDRMKREGVYIPSIKYVEDFHYFRELIKRHRRETPIEVLLE
jgi:hypothetical protein